MHYTLGVPPAFSGGLVEYVMDVAAHQVKEGHDVTILYPSHRNDRKSKAINGIETIGLDLGVKSPHSGGVVNPRDYIEDYRNTESIGLRGFDVAHFHTLRGLSETFLSDLRDSGTRLIYTTHDFYGVCAKGTLLTKQRTLCNGPSAKDCKECSQGSDGRGVLQRVRRYWWVSALLVKLSKISMIRKVAYRFKTNSQQGGNNVKVYGMDAWSEYIDWIAGLYLKFDLCIFNSKDSRKLVMTNTSLDLARTKILPACLKGTVGAKQISNNRDKGKFTFGFHGGTKTHKGYNLLLRVVRRLNDLGLEFDVIIRGSMFSDADAPTNVKFKGTYNQDDLDEIYCQYDCFLFPSIWRETLGLTVVEAVSRGVPVIVSKLAGVTEYLTNCTTINAREHDLFEAMRGAITKQQVVPTLSTELNYEYHIEGIEQSYGK